MSRDRDRIVGSSLFEALAHLAVPAVASTLFSIIFEVVDMFWVGRLGAVPVAALSASSFCVWTFRALALTVATGALAIVSRRTGEGRFTQAGRTIRGALHSTVVFAAIVGLPSLPFLRVIFDWIGVEGEVARLAEAYALVFLCGLPFVFLMVTCEHCLRGMGDARRPMVITGAALLLNALLDPLFIFTFDLGLPGAAWATVVSQVVGCALMGWILFRRVPGTEGTDAPRGGELREFFPRMVRIGLPVSLSGAAFSMIYLGLTWVISAFGTAPLAAMGIGHRIEAFPYFLSVGLSMAAAAMVGQNLGAGQSERARKSVMILLAASTAALAAFAAAFVLFPRFLYGCFIGDEQVILEGVHYLRIIAVFEVFLGFEVILEGAFSGAGDTKPPFLVIFPLTILRIPLAHLFAIRFGMGVTAVWWVISVTTLAKGGMLYLLFLRGGWMRHQV